MAREYIKRYEKEIRPRIKLYKFENLPEDVQEKVINDEIQFREDILLEELQDFGEDVLSEYLVNKGINLNSQVKLETWDIYERELTFSFDGTYKKYNINYKDGNINSYSDYEMNDLPDKIYDKISEIIDEAKEETLASIKSYYENYTDSDNVKKDLIEEGHLYTIKGEFKE
jgi:hypothetical protein